MIVVDASLAAKLVIGERDSDLADRWYLTTTSEIVAPDLIAVEVAQAVVRRVNARQTAMAAGRQALDAWRDILLAGGITLIRTDVEHIDAAAELAMQLGHPVKDCVYLGLAMERDCDLATSDAKFAHKARTVHPAVKLLAEYSAS